VAPLLAVAGAAVAELPEQALSAIDMTASQDQQTSALLLDEPEHSDLPLSLQNRLRVRVRYERASKPKDAGIVIKLSRPPRTTIRRARWAPIESLFAAGTAMLRTDVGERRPRVARREPGGSGFRLPLTSGKRRRASCFRELAPFHLLLSPAAPP